MSQPKLEQPRPPNVGKLMKGYQGGRAEEYWGSVLWELGSFFFVDQTVIGAFGFKSSIQSW